MTLLHVSVLVKYLTLISFEPEIFTTRLHVSNHLTTVLFHQVILGHLVLLLFRGNNALLSLLACEIFTLLTIIANPVFIKRWSSQAPGD